MKALIAIKAFLSRLPGWLIWGLIGVAVMVAGVFLHERSVQRAISDAYNNGRAEEKKSWEGRLADANKDALRWRADYERAAADLSKLERERNDQDARAIRDAAADLLLRGPGRSAACPGSGGGTLAGAAAGGRDQTGGGSDDPVAPVPAGEGLALVPWPGLTRYAQQADLNRAEVQSWRSWYLGQQKLLEERRKALEIDGDIAARQSSTTP